MTKIKDVAEFAGVSVATVSRVLNASDRVNQETREKVLAAIEALKYSPSALGRNLRVACTKNILVILPTIANDFYSTIIAGIRRKATIEGYNIVLGVTENDDAIEQEYIRFLETKVVDGVIFLSPREERHYLRRYLKAYPIVQCSEKGLEEGITTVAIDNLLAAYDATRYLIALGHKKIAFIGGREAYTSVKLRREGFKGALEEQGIEIPDTYYQDAKFSYNSGKEACEKLLVLEDPPTAIFTIADTIAVGAIKKIQEFGKQVGKDIDVIGFDDTAIAKMYCPSITTIAQPRFELGEKACEMLIQRINHLSSEPINIIVKHELKIRESTGNQNLK